MSKLKLAVTAIFIFMLSAVTSVSAEQMMLEYDGATHLYDGAVYNLVVNSHTVDTPLEPIIFNDRALVPVREIFEEVGAQVNYNAANQEVEVLSDNTDILMTINDNIAYVNGNRTAIPDNVVPKLIAKAGESAKMMVPVRFISENIGMDVVFDGEINTIFINSDDHEAAKQSGVSITEVTPSVTGDNKIQIDVKADGAISGYTPFVLTDPGRLVIDFPSVGLANIIDNIAVNAAGVTTVRLGVNPERARVVTDAEIVDYKIDPVSESELIISLTTKVNPVVSMSTQVAAAVSNPQAPAGTKLVVLDAGHGGQDSGAVGALDGQTILEKDIALAITYKTKEILESNGISVIMTRSDDTFKTLQERPELANNANAAIFVSIHINSVEGIPTASGTEVYYAESNNGGTYGTTSANLAQNILDRMIANMGSVNRGVKTAEHAVTKRSLMPAALAEVGFITNETELRNMISEDYQYKTAQGIAEGIMTTLQNVTVPQK